jgi:hypothetical protein
MRKLRIQLDDLQVESFATDAQPAERGTVHARVPDTDPGWCPQTGDAYCTFGHGCTMANYTCGGWNCQTWEAAHCRRYTVTYCPD